MAQRKETKEPYVQVTESVKRATQNPAAGLSLVLGGVIISDSGPSTPQLVSSRSEFLELFSSKDLTKEYMDSIDKLYRASEKSTMASTMFLNAYRLVGSCQMLICRASSACGVNFMKPLHTSTEITNKEYLVRDSEVLVKIPEFSITIGEEPEGWIISVDGVGTIGNMVTEGGPQYDYYVVTPDALAEKLNETSKFYSPDYVVESKKVTFKEAYIAANFLDIDDSRTEVATRREVNALDLDDDFSRVSSTNKGYVGLTISAELNDAVNEEIDYMAINLGNTATPLSVEIRRYNHLTVIGESSDGYQVDDKAYESLKGDTSQDFYQFTIKDNEGELKYNVGESTKRGDITVDDLLEMTGDKIQFVLPQNLVMLGLEYTKAASKSKAAQQEVIKVNLSVPTESSKLLEVSLKSIQNAWDLIQEDERYVVEGVCDLGCTDTQIQNYIASMAQSFNAFYPISPVNSTNYMTISGHASKIVMGNSPMNLYHIAPWDYDDGTVGFKYNCSPAVLYWEAVSRNRKANNEFAGVLGENNGIVSPVNLSKNFTKKERQMLLTKNINTIFNDMSNDITYINDNWTKQEEVDVMREENNVRLKIRISKAMPKLLKQFIGRQSNVKTWNDVYGVINYWFNNTIKTMNYSISDVKIICDETNNTPETIRANKLVVRIMVRYYNVTKYIEVYHKIKVVTIYSNVYRKSA